MREDFENEEKKAGAFLQGLNDEERQLLNDDQVNQPFESKVRHLIDEETEQEDEDKLNQVEAYLEQYKQQTEKEESESQSKTEDPLAGVAIIEEIMADQTKFSAYVSTIMEEE